MSELPIEEPQKPHHPIAERLEVSGIKRIAIIDDAYDLPSRRDIGDDLILDFLAEVEADDEAHLLLVDISERLDVSLDDPYEIKDELWVELWTTRGESGALKKHCDRLFRHIDQKQSQLKPLHDILVRDLRRDVDCFGSSANLTDLSTKMIFIDYILGPDQQSIEVAKSIARETYGKYESEPSKPVIILMSSMEVSEEMIEAFREESELLGGTFYFIEKREFSNKVKLYLKLGTWAMALPYSEKIQTFITALQNSVEEVSKTFIKNIRKLSVDDYAYLQKLSLHEDGHPLGDYMLWLYSSHFGQLLFEADTVREQQKVIDSITFKNLPPSQTKPSRQLAEVYKSALFAKIGDIEIHPRTPTEKEGDPKQMYMHLGDLFQKEGSDEVWMIINAQCDLSFAPDAARQSKGDRSILMIPGKVEPLSKKLNDTQKDKAKTELFEHKGKPSRIMWDTKRVTSHKHEEIKAWKDEQGYSRTTRLRLPFALEVQRAFATDLTRVGMPVSPPIYQEVMVQLLCPDESGKVEFLEESKEGAFLFLTREEELCIFTEDFISRTNGKIVRAVENIRKWLEFLKSKGAKTEMYEGWIVELSALKDNYEALLPLQGPFVVPVNNDPEELKGYPICIGRKLGLSKTYRFKTPLVINVVDM